MKQLYDTTRKLAGKIQTSRKADKRQEWGNSDQGRRPNGEMERSVKAIECLLIVDTVYV